MANPVSRLNQARAAIRPEMKGRVMLSGPPGAGKTYSGLIIATALVGPEGRILGIDSEKESMLTYADLFTFDHLRWNPPFDPTALALTLKDAQANYDAVIIDSFSHWWRKQGGVLDIAGDNIRGWKVARPVQEDLIDVLLDVDMHVIVCCRSKMDHSITQEGGKTVVTKLGVKAQQDDDLEYEVNVALEVDMAHVLSVVKSRTNEVPVGTQYLAGYAGDFALHYRDWLRSGEPVASKEDTDALAEALGRIPDEVERKRAKYLFLDVFGRPEFLLVSRLEEAQAWVADRILGIAPPVDRAEGEVPPEDPGGGGGSPSSPPAGGGAEASSAGNSDQAPESGVASLTPANSVAASPAPADQTEPAVASGAPSGPPVTAAVEDGDGAAPPAEPAGPGATTTEPAAPASGEAPHSSPDATPLPDDSAVVKGKEVKPPPAAGQAAGNPSGEPAKTAAEIAAEVQAMTVETVKTRLIEANLPYEGAPKTLRARLVTHIMEQPF